jgi:hypothetical protein
MGTGKDAVSVRMARDIDRAIGDAPENMGKDLATRGDPLPQNAGFETAGRVKVRDGDNTSE